MSMVQMSMDHVDAADSAPTTVMSMDVDAQKTALDAFWLEYRLLHVKDTLCAYLGTETLVDLDDVHPGDLQTLRASQWAEARLTIAEANRLARAIKDYHAAKHPFPLPGVEHLPRCKECACQNPVYLHVDPE